MIGRMLLVMLGVAVAVPSGAADLQPHRATFNLSLQPGGAPGVLGVIGRWLVEYEVACDGTVTRQAQQMLIRDASGKTTETRWTTTVWEREDGREMTFDTNATFGEQADPPYAGRAVLADDTNGLGRVEYDKPVGGFLALRAGTVFPNQHSRMTLDAALRGEKLLNDEVFEGGPPQNYTQINSAIAEATVTDPAAPELAGRRAWTIREAHFRPGSRIESPAFEVGFRVYEGGIIDTVDLDYGPFRVAGKLTSLELLPAPRC